MRHRFMLAWMLTVCSGPGWAQDYEKPVLDFTPSPANWMEGALVVRPSVDDPLRLSAVESVTIRIARVTILRRPE